ncbi:MAG: FtsX-like permease family protein, partial [Bacteroidota bacterium]
NSLKSQIEPTIFLPRVSCANSLIKLSTDELNTSLSEIETIWRRHFPDAPYDPRFLDDSFEKMYQADVQFGRIFGTFAFLAIFVALLGLLGLASYTALQRTKEMGVRKVLGASVSNIVLLFSKDFVWLIGIAFVMAGPLIYLSMSEWLSGYAFRIDFPWWVLLITLLLLALLAFITISIQSLKVATSNPMEILRNE